MPLSGLYDFFGSVYRSGLAALSRIAGRPFRYHQDGLFTVANADFMRDPTFAHAYRLGVDTCGRDLNIHWRVYVCCWAAKYALSRDGDFIECGVNTGYTSRAVVDYVAFDKSPHTFYLMDTFEGIPETQYTAGEITSGLPKRYAYADTYDAVKWAFRDFPNVVLVKGTIPNSLRSVPATKIAYLSIDMNAVAPEVAAAEYFWDRVVSGGIIVMDDYGWPRHTAQKRGFDAFAAERGVSVLSIATGQGIIIKP